MRFIKLGVVIPYGTGIDSTGTSEGGACFIWFHGRLFCYYAAYDGSTQRLAYANSLDGLRWTKGGICLDVGAPGTIDDVGLPKYGLSAIELNGTIFLAGARGTVRPELL